VAVVEENISERVADGIHYAGNEYPDRKLVSPKSQRQAEQNHDDDDLHFALPKKRPMVWSSIFLHVVLRNDSSPET
jgi:hypothetical protein